MTRRTSTRDPRVLKLQLWRPANHVFSKPACCGCRRFGGMRILLFRYHWSDPVCIIVNQKAQVGKQISPGLSMVVVSFRCLCHCSAPSDQLGGWGKILPSMRLRLHLTPEVRTPCTSSTQGATCWEVAAHQKEVHQSGAAPLGAPICA